MLRAADLGYRMLRTGSMPNQAERVLLKAARREVAISNLQKVLFPRR